ncbi:MAG: thioredoxin family protein [Candidatus Riflebacteria bacterium]|nr:thioredoxin family protein [Candidatus Riflebacteria bacterium]
MLVFLGVVIFSSTAVAEDASDTAIPAIASLTPVESESKIATVSLPLPKMVDVGAGKCLSCKKMAPILEEAKKLYTGVAEVEFVDVWENRDAGAKYGVRMIPTQIFFDGEGKEVFRHEGFFSLEDIQKQFESLGAKLKRE